MISDISTETMDDGSMIVTNHKGVIFGHFVYHESNERVTYPEWVFYPFRNVFIRYNSLSQIVEELNRLNTENRLEKED